MPAFNKEYSDKEPHVSDIIIELMQKHLPEILTETLKAGVPIVYVDDKNDLVKEFHDGTIQIIKHFGRI